MAACWIGSTCCSLPRPRITSTCRPDVKRVAILGSTGSIGRSTLAVVDAHPQRLKVVSLAAGENAALLAEQVTRYCPDVVAMASGESIDRLRAACGPGVPAVGTGT